MMNKKTLITIIALGLILSVAAYGGDQVLAGDTQNHGTLVSRIAQKFNLKEADVQAVFDSVQDEHMAEMKAKLEERLAQAVKDGVITETQKQALLSKMEERHDERVADRTAMQKWLKDQGVDGAKLRPYLMPGGGRHMRLWHK